MKKVTYLLLAALLATTIVLNVYIECQKKEVQMKGEVIDKYTTFDKNGHNVSYHVIIKYADGVVEDETHSVSYYASLKTGTSYFFTVKR